MTQLQVAVVMGVLTALIIGWGIYLALDGRKSNTISAVVRGWNRRFGGIGVALTFVFGLLIGHWFW